MDYVTRQFINLTKKLRDDLRKGLTALRDDLKHGIKAIDDQRERDKQEAKAQEERRQQMPLPILHAELRTEESEKREQNTYNKRSFVLQVILALGTWLAFLATATYAYFTIRQWHELIAARHQAQIGIDAARLAACVADQTLKRRPYEFRVEQRPYVTLDDFRLTTAITVTNPNGNSELRISFFNSGKTPALNFSLDPASLDIRVGETRVTIITEKSSIGSKAVIGTEKNMAFEFPFTMFSKTKTEYESNKVLLTVRGVIKYTDIFNRPHHTAFCAQNRHDWGTAFLACGGFGTNDIDREVSTEYMAQPECK